MKRCQILVLACICHFANGQINQQNVFENLSNQQLFDKVISTYKTGKTLEYAVARDTLFGKIDIVKDTIECIYTGLKVYIAPGSDPTQAIFAGPGGGMNTEHGYPQGKGATGIARSDMHHLYATRVAANTARMSSPLGDIPDSSTEKWFRGAEELTTKPSSNIDAYSESTNSRFEPREKSKGNLARSIFYFYTFYQDQADAADPNFFDIQKANLCQWHIDDPVDAQEWKRTWGIAKHQEGKPNPFVLDCSLISRMYCNNIDQVCEELVRKASYVNDVPNVSPLLIFPNPAVDGINILSRQAFDELIIKDFTGKIRCIYRFDQTNQKYIELEMLPPGVYIIHGLKQHRHSSLGKFVVLP